MAIQPYREKVQTFDCCQYDGTNKQELLGFAPGFVVEVDGVLGTVRNPFPLAVTEWVMQDAAGVFSRLDDVAFQYGYVHGSAPAM